MPLAMPMRLITTCTIVKVTNDIPSIIARLQSTRCQAEPSARHAARAGNFTAGGNSGFAVAPDTFCCRRLVAALARRHEQAVQGAFRLYFARNYWRVGTSGNLRAPTSPETRRQPWQPAHGVRVPEPLTMTCMMTKPTSWASSCRAKELAGRPARAGRKIVLRGIFLLAAAGGVWAFMTGQVDLAGVAAHGHIGHAVRTGAPARSPCSPRTPRRRTAAAHRNRTGKKPGRGRCAVVATATGTLQQGCREH